MNDYAREDTRLKGAIERILSGDMTGHENCGDGHCEVASPGGAYGSDHPFQNFLVGGFGLDNAEAVGFDMGLRLAKDFPDLMARAVAALDNECGGAPPAEVMEQSRARLQMALDEHYPVDA